MAGEDDPALVAAAAEDLADRLLTDALGRRTWRERAQGRRIARLLNDPAGLAFTVALTDEVLRIRDPARAAEHFRNVAADPAAARFLGPLDRALLAAGRRLATALPGAVMPLVRQRVRTELAGFVVPAESRPFGRYLARRRAEGVRVNVNLLGEAILGEDEARRRTDAVTALLSRPDVDYVSVKVSSICAQLNIAAFDDEVDRVAARLRQLYDEALRHRPPKFVNLDMEEYRDLDLTVAAFRRVLDEPSYERLDAGIVLQAYVPDSFAVLDDLVTWARHRHARCGSSIKIRLVKGANLAMETVEAELAGWQPATFAAKSEVDASYKRLLGLALWPANAGALRVGVASHNLFELAWALTLSEARGVRDMVEVEMLEGMAPASARAVREAAGGLLLYAPVARRADAESTIAYLVRRFDENTGPDNFLRHQFSLFPTSQQWIAERERFQASVKERLLPPPPSRRAGPASAPGNGFTNRPDTDVAVAANRRWLAAQLRPLPELGIDVVPAVVAGRTVAELPLRDGVDPGEPGRVAYRWAACTPEIVDEAVAAARTAGTRWRATPIGDRARLVREVGAVLQADRGRLVGVMARDGGKTFSEGDPEVSEAVDFSHYYAERALDLDDQFVPYGTIAVVPPWNFPLAIPAGGVLAALAAGNAVLFKPAPETVATGWALAEACWRAGIPRDVLQFVPCADDDAGRRLIAHRGVDAVVLTGSWDTARMFLGWRPGLALHAETSGKNAMLITATADLDQAVADLVLSAFGHAGQKCSAASLAIVEASVYDDPRFRRQLADAVRSLRSGPGWHLRTTMGPLIRPPEGPLARALGHLDSGEWWLVQPRQVGDNPHQWTPGVKFGVAPGSWFHLTECFGPVLGVMRAKDLDEAVVWQNQPAYGLTAGLQSLDPAEIAVWRDRVEAGNLYVNRHITGAIVRRQPFGGWKRSVVGPGAKTGGPSYVASLGAPSGRFDGDLDTWRAEAERIWRDEMGPADPSGLRAESNVLRWRSLRAVLLHAGADVREDEVARALATAEALEVSVEIVDSDDQLADALPRRNVDKVRLLGAVPPAFVLAAHDAGHWVDTAPVGQHPRVEARRWAREQAVSETRHRHGDVTRRRPALLDG